MCRAGCRTGNRVSTSLVRLVYEAEPGIRVDDRCMHGISRVNPVVRHITSNFSQDPAMRLGIFLRSSICSTVLFAAVPAVAFADPLTVTVDDLDHDGQFANAQVYNGFGCRGDNVSPRIAWARSAWHQKHRRHAVRSGCPDRGPRLDALGSRQHPAFGNVDSERGIGRCAAHAGGRARDADGFWRIQVRWAMPAARRVSSIYRDGVRVVHSACRREIDVESGGRCLSDAWKHPWTGAIYRDLPPSVELIVSAGSLAG